MFCKRVTLANAKRIACESLDSHKQEILDAFTAMLPQGFEYNHDCAKRRVSNAVFMDTKDCEERVRRGDEIFGETDGDQIWINPLCSYNEMVLTLVHEALHDTVFLRRATRTGPCKGLSVDFEHNVMKRLPFCM